MTETLKAAKKVVIAFDLDDTVFNVNDYFKAALAALGHNTDVPMHWWDMEGYDGDGPMLIKRACFMSDSEPNPGWEHLPVMVDHFKAAYDKRVEFIYLTHRGYHPMAESLTNVALKRHGLESIPLHCVDPGIWHLKHEWLEAHYPAGTEFILVDDFGQYGARPLATHRVIVCDKPWNTDIIDKPRINSYPQLVDTLRRELRTLLTPEDV